MNERSIVIIGFPESGKTTFLAALWHLITERDVATELRFHTLRSGEASHLNAIAARWRDAK
ncbi:MAG: TRAFAC clade GTPase domain-containing protein, partial [Rhodanobacter sp.]